MNDITNGKFGYFTRACARNIRNSDDGSRHMARRGTRANGQADGAPQIIIKICAIGHSHKQNNPYIILPILTNDQRFGDCIKSFDLTVNFGRANANTARV